MWGLVIGAIFGAVAGGVANGVMTAKATDAKVGAYKEAAKEVRDAVKQYAGANAYNQMNIEGANQADLIGNAVGGELAAQRYDALNPGVTGAGAMNAADNAATESTEATNEASQKGLLEGMKQAGDTMDAKYNAATARAHQLMKQADIDYNVANQRNQEIMNTISNLGNTFNSLRSTKNGRNYANSEQ